MVIRTSNALAPSKSVRVLVLVPGRAEGHMSGPQIRGWEVARALAGRFTVTVALHGPAPAASDGVRVVGSDRRTILAETLRHDVVIAPWIQPFLIPALIARGVVLVPDLYDPAEIELATGEGPVDEAEMRSLRSLTDLQLLFADLLMCGSTRQRSRLIDLVGRARGRRGPPPVVVVPFGLPDPPPKAGGHALRELVGLSPGDVVILWWGTIWRWFDPQTAIRAVADLSATRPNVRLVFTAGPPPDAAARPLVRTEEARQLADEAGVLSKNVFFIDRWLPYEERHAYLQDADVGLTLHAEDAEAELAVRARYFDYLWCSLPCVLSRGDELAEELASAGVASLVPAGDVGATAKALEELIDDPGRHAAAVSQAGALARQRGWRHVVEPLAASIEDALRGRKRRRFAGLAALPRVAGFYSARARDLLLGRLKRRG